MSALDRKLWRETWALRGQVLAIAVVIAGGVSTLLMSLATLDSLTLTRDAFYRDYRFPEVFVSLKRAPESLRETVAALPGVGQVETRVVAAVNLDLSDFPDPVTGVLSRCPSRMDSISSICSPAACPSRSAMTRPWSARPSRRHMAFAPAPSFRPSSTAVSSG